MLENLFSWVSLLLNYYMHLLDNIFIRYGGNLASHVHLCHKNIFFMSHSDGRPNLKLTCTYISWTLTGIVQHYEFLTCTLLTIFSWATKKIHIILPPMYIYVVNSFCFLSHSDIRNSQPNFHVPKFNVLVQINYKNYLFWSHSDPNFNVLVHKTAIWRDNY